MRPRIFVDLKSKKNILRNPSNRINLRYDRVIRIPLKSVLSGFLALFVVCLFVFNFVIAPIDTGAKAAVSSAEERKALEAQLADIEKQISDYESKISDYQKQGTSLQSEITKLNSKISKFNLQIKAITLTLSKINKDLDDTQSQIKTTQGEIENKKESISSIIQNIYENERTSNVAMLLANVRISDFFLEASNLSNIQDSLKANLEDLMNLQSKLSDQKENLASEKNDTLNLKSYQEQQRLAIQQTKSEKDTLLKETKGKESEYQKVLAESKKTAAQIRSRIFELLGGGEMKFEDAYKLAKFASEKTGVNVALILAVLDRESALGQNVGKCKYNVNPYYPTRASNPTTMHPTRDIPLFLQLTSQLGINPDSVTVSCPIPQDGAYGGGMGPAQFIPSTWNLYKDKIASLTGNNPPSPWNNLDAFMATALYLKDAGATNSLGYSSKVAAAKYYAGARWSRYMSSYGAAVIAKAQDFMDDIATLIA